MARVKPPYGLPTKLKICGFSFDVEYYDNMNEINSADNGTNAASVNAGLQILRVATVGTGCLKRPYESMIHVMLHEIIHIFAVKYKIGSLAWDSDNCEDNTERLSNAITDFLFSNGYLKREK